MQLEEVGYFKSQALSFFGDGAIRSVKSSTVQFQGRFWGTEYTQGLAASKQFVVGVAFFNEHKIENRSLDSGFLTVDKVPVKSSSPSSFAGAGFTLSRLQGMKYTEGLAATKQIVVGGAFFNGHKFEMVTLDNGALTVDNGPVKSSSPSYIAGAGITLSRLQGTKYIEGLAPAVDVG